MTTRSQAILETVRELVKDPTYSSYADINRAHRQIGRLTNWNFLRKSSTSLLAFSGSTASYTLDMSAMRRLTAIRFKKTTAEQEWVLLEEVPRHLYESKVRSNRRSDGTDDEKPPEFFYLEGGPTATILLAPTPDTNYTARVEYIAKIAEIEQDVEPQTPADYDDIVSYLAAGLILERTDNDAKIALGSRYTGRAMAEFEKMVADVHPNRTDSLDRSAITWMR